MEDVFAFRYENIKDTSKVSFTKKDFANAVAFGKFGATNKRKTIFGSSHEKCTVVFLRCLPDDLREVVVQGKG